MISLVLLVSGCDQRDSGIGIDAVTNVSDQDFFSISGTGTASGQWVPKLSNGLGQSLQIGNTADFIASSAIMFDLTDALPESIEVVQVKYRLSTARIYPEGGSPDLRVVVKEITEEWEQRALVPDTLQLVDEYPVLDSILIPARTDSSFSYNLPLELFDRWVAGDTTTFGLWLEPINDGVMVELHSIEGGSNQEDAETIPLLEISGTRWEMDEDSNWVESDLDTVIFAMEDAYDAEDLSIPQPGRVHVSAGYPQRALFYFPLDTLEDYTSRLVAHAEMWLYADSLDPANMNYIGTSLQFKDASIMTAAWVENPDSLETVALRFIALEETAFDSTNTLLRFDVTSIASNWLARIDENGGLQVQTSGENQFLRRQVLHAHDTENESKRPKLFIWYVEPSN